MFVSIIFKKSHVFRKHNKCIETVTVENGFFNITVTKFKCLRNILFMISCNYALFQISEFYES